MACLLDNNVNELAPAPAPLAHAAPQCTAPVPLLQFAGWWGLFVAGVAWYIAAADIINEQFARVRLTCGVCNVHGMHSASSLCCGRQLACFAEACGDGVLDAAVPQTVLPVGKWSVGVPMARALKRMMAKVGLRAC